MEYKIPSLSSFTRHKCPCCSRLQLQSCADIHMSKAMHYMRALAKYIHRNNKTKEGLASCTCPMHTIAKHNYTTYLNKKVKDLVEKTCCPVCPQPTLAYGIGSIKKIPKLIPWKCVSGTCINCGIDCNLKMMECPILACCNHLQQADFQDLQRTDWKDPFKDESEAQKGIATMSPSKDLNSSTKKIHLLITKI